VAKPYKTKINKDGMAGLSPRSTGWQLMGVIIIVSGVLILLNLPQRKSAVRSASTPVIVREGLLVKGSDAEVYLFLGYTLHRIINPTPAQQAEAQQVDDSFLARYGCGEPVDQYGHRLAEQTLPANGQFCPPALPATTSSASALSMMLGWLGGIVGLAGGIWWLTHAFQDRDRTAGQADLKPHLQEAAIYTEQIEQFLKASPNQQPRQLLGQIHKWQQTIEELARSLATLNQNDLMVRDLVTVPKVITDLEQQLAAETNPALRSPLEYMLAQRKNQLAALERLQTTMRQAEIQIEMTVALLGTIYSQLLTQQSTSHVADYHRLADNVDEEVQRLQDYLEALQEVKNPSYLQAIPQMVSS
jgi:hypothetical protein